MKQVLGVVALLAAVALLAGVNGQNVAAGKPVRTPRPTPGCFYTVYGTFDTEPGKVYSCTVQPDGDCIIESDRITNAIGCTWFRVIDIVDSCGLHPYDATLNTDPDNDSDGTSIQVCQDGSE